MRASWLFLLILWRRIFLLFVNLYRRNYGVRRFHFLLIEIMDTYHKIRPAPIGAACCTDTTLINSQTYSEFKQIVSNLHY